MCIRDRDCCAYRRRACAGGHGLSRVLTHSKWTHREAALHRQRFLGILPKLNVVGSIPITRCIEPKGLTDADSQSGRGSGLAPGRDGLGGSEKRPGLLERRVVPDRVERKTGEARGGVPERVSVGQARGLTPFPIASRRPLSLLVRCSG